MNTEPLLAPFAKIERAETQINELERIIKQFVTANPYKVAAEIDREADIQIWRFVPSKKFPRTISIVAGEILHNLRSPLDQVLCALALQSNRSESGVQFPFGESRDEFEAALKKQKKLPADAIDLIRTLKPYKGGNDLLWNLNHLNKRDKHRVGLMPVSLRNATNLSKLIVWEGVALTVGSRQGKFLSAPRPSPEEIAKMSRPTGHYEMPPGLIVDFGNAGSPDESLEFMTTTPGAKFTSDIQPSLDVAFRDVEGLKPEPVVAVLHQMRQLVEGILLTFEKRFFN